MFTPARFSIVLLLVASSPSIAGDFDLLPTYNQSPLVQIYGLPSPGEARVLAPGRLAVAVSYEAANSFFIGRNDNERLLLDGETHRAAVSIRYGGGAMEWGVEVPYIAHGGGFMDGFIERWHDAFGLPNGGREDFPRDRLSYIYERNGIERLRITESTSGVGDVRLLGAWQLREGEGVADLALRVSLKLPTGDAAALQGSGAADLAVWFTAGCAAAACPGALGWSAYGGVLGLGHGDVLPELQRPVVVFGGAGVGWRVLPPTVIKAELHVHSPLYEGSRLAPLNTTAIQLVLGGTWNFSPRTALDIAMSEDLRVDTAPDVSVLISLRSSF
ncbi:MAG: DUF3187 family protein [Sulfurifustis sp.]